MCPKIEIVLFVVPLIIENVPNSFVLAVLIDHFYIPRVAFYNINIGNSIWSLFNMTFLIGYIVTIICISIYILFDKLLPLF